MIIFINGLLKRIYNPTRKILILLHSPKMTKKIKYKLMDEFDCLLIQQLIFGIIRLMIMIV